MKCIVSKLSIVIEFPGATGQIHGSVKVYVPPGLGGIKTCYS